MRLRLYKGLSVLSTVSLVFSTSLAGVFLTPTPTTHAATSVLFADDFESGDLATQGWVTTSPGGAPTTPQVLPEAQSTLSAGSFGVRLDGDGDDTLTKTFSTKEFFNVRLSYDRKTNGLEGNDHFLSRFDVNADGGFKTIEDIQNDADWATTTPLSLTGAAAHNAQVGIRYRVLGDSAEELAYLDNVTVTGDPIVRNSPQITCGEPVDIMLVLDRSASMDDLGGTPPRPIQDARDAAKNFVNIVSGGSATLTNHRIGVVSFSDTATLNIPLSTDVTAINTAIDGLTAGGRTNMQAGIEMGLLNLGGGANTAMILLSDGRANEPDPEEEAPNAAIARGNEAKTAGVRFYTIGLNMIGDHPAENTLKAIASQEALYSGGTEDDLEEMFSEIAFQLCPIPGPLTLAKTDGKTTATPGTTLPYQLTLTNPNPDPVMSVTVTDAVPLQCASVMNIVPNTASFAGGTVTWTLDSIPAGATTLSFDCVLGASFAEGTTIVHNTAKACETRRETCVTATDDTNVTVEPQGTPGVPPTNPPSVPNQGLPIAPSVTFDKTDTTDPVKPGENITYVLTYTVSNAAVNNLILVDQLPNTVSFVSAIDGGQYNNADHTVRWSFGTVQPGTYVTNVTVKTSATLTNNTAVRNNATLTGTQTGTVLADETTLINASPLLSVAKKASKATVNPGDTVAYTVSVRNAGTAAAERVVVTDTLPKGLTLAETGAETFTLNVGMIKAGETFTTTYETKVAADAAAGTVENLVVVTAENHGTISAKAPVTIAVVQVLGATDEGEVLGAIEPVLPETGMSSLDLFLISMGSLLMAAGALGVRTFGLARHR